MPRSDASDPMVPGPAATTNGQASRRLQAQRPSACRLPQGPRPSGLSPRQVILITGPRPKTLLPEVGKRPRPSLRREKSVSVRKFRDAHMISAEPPPGRALG